MLEMAFPWEQAPTQHAFRVITHTFPSIGLSQAKPLGSQLYPQENRLDREESLKLYTMGAVGFYGRRKKGALAPGQLADLLFSLPTISPFREEIKHLESVLTIVGGKVVYAPMNSQTCAVCTACEPKLVSRQRVRCYAKQPTQPVAASHSASCSHVTAPAHGGRNRTFK